MSQKTKEFFLSSWAVNNKKTVYILTVILIILGVQTYNSLPKESFPEIVVPTIYVSTVYPGTAPANMENLVTKQIEKQIKAIAGVKKITSNSLQDFSNVIIEFNTDVDPKDAKQKVSDAVDKAKTDLPEDLPQDPTVMEINFSEFPIMNINIAGPYDLKQLNYYAEEMQDRIEAMKEITRVDLIGAPEREIQINVDMYKMQAAQITLGDIERTIAMENLTISGGNIDVNESKTIVSVKKEFSDMDEIRNLLINSQSGASIPLHKIAEVKDTTKEQESFARMNGQSVITLNVVKRAGENLVEASDKIQALIKEMKEKSLPKNLEIVITGDQSDQTRVTLHDLINTIIIGFVLVTIVLMFFMGVTNALFVGLSVPLSMCIAFLMMPGLDFTLNMIVLFAFLLALGIVVDDAIVVIENTHRIFDNGKVPIEQAAKTAAGEVFLPVLSGTMTTLAPFVPLAFWPGLIGSFMFFLPITLIVTLTASLLVAYLINPVFAVDFMKPHTHEKKGWTRGMTVNTILFVLFALIMHGAGSPGTGNFILFVLLFYIFERLVLTMVIERFQNKTWPRVQERYKRFLKRFLRYPVLTVWGTVGLFIFSVVFMMVRGPKVVFFPESDPNFVYTYINLPVGTSPQYTDSITSVVEKKITQVVGKNNPVVSSIISNVTIGVTDPAEGPGPAAPNKGKVSVAFVKFAERNGVSTRKYLDDIRKAMKNFIPGAEITVDQEQSGPPTQKPINIEISGDNIDTLKKAADQLRKYLVKRNIPGVEELKSDFESGKPELVYDIDRERAQREGISAGQVGMELRNAIFGKEVSKFRDANDEYPIMVRYRFDQRNSVDQLSNTRITYRDMNMGGMIRSVPISAFTKEVDTTSFGGIKRKNLKRVITLFSNVTGDYNPNEVVADVQSKIDEYTNTVGFPPGVMVKMTGEQEEQAETAAFLGNAMMISLMLIFLILVTQFNSLGKPIIILVEIFFSIIGVLIGVAIFKMDMSIVMTGVGIVALAGIVVRNGILLVEFTDVLRERGYSTFDAIVEAGRTRMTPVLLTATATILGLIPLAVGLNIDFGRLFSEGNPNIFFGGDSVAFWGPLSWTMIFGLSFATFLTLILIPVMYLLMARAKKRGEVLFKFLGIHPILIYIPGALTIARIYTWLRYRKTGPSLKNIEF